MVRRFLRSYAFAATAANLGFLLWMVVASVGDGSSAATLRSLPSSAVIFEIYSLLFTLVLGLVGWAILSLLHVSKWPGYLVAGVVLGCLTGGVDGAFRFDPNSPFIAAFGIAGALAGVTFYATYYRSSRPTSGAAAA